MADWLGPEGLGVRDVVLCPAGRCDRSMGPGVAASDRRRTGRLREGAAVPGEEARPVLPSAKAFDIVPVGMAVAPSMPDAAAPAPLEKP